MTGTTCPNCQAQFTAPIHSIIDGQDPELKSALLQGRLNVAECPQCGLADILNSPLLYYDQEKELALVLAPNDLHLMGADQEKVIGNLTNTLINSLPAEERKFYLFNPKQFLTMDGLIKAVLEADGITEEITNALAKQKGLRVAARTSAFAFKGERIDIREIGKKLNVAHVIEGSVRRSERALRITAQLISAEDGYHLWSEQFERDHGDVFRIQEEIALSVAGRLLEEVSGLELAMRARYPASWRAQTACTEQ